MRGSGAKIARFRLRITAPQALRRLGAGTTLATRAGRFNVYIASCVTRPYAGCESYVGYSGRIYRGNSSNGYRHVHGHLGSRGELLGVSGGTISSNIRKTIRFCRHEGLAARHYRRLLTVVRSPGVRSNSLVELLGMRSIARLSQTVSTGNGGHLPGVRGCRQVGTARGAREIAISRVVNVRDVPRSFSNRLFSSLSALSRVGTVSFFRS